MAAIIERNNYNGVAFGLPVRPRVPAPGDGFLVDVAPPKWKPNIFKRTWTAFKFCILDNPLTQWCCGTGEDDHMYEYDREIRSQIDRCLLRRNQGIAVCGVVDAMREVYEETGYDLGHAAHVYRSYGAVDMTPQQRARLDITEAIPLRAPDIEHTETKVVPLFAASMVAHLRAKLGRMARDEANYLVLRREYLRKCKAHHVRDVDVMAHEQHVMNAFFGNETFDKVGFGKARASRFRRWVNDDPTDRTAPQVC